MARNFNGTSDIIAVSLPTTAVTNVSYAFWMYQTSTSALPVPVVIGDTTANGYAIITEYSGNPGNLNGNLNGVQTQQSSSPLALNTWMHIAHINNAGTWFLYVNGLSVTITFSTATALTPTGSMFIGSDNHGNAFPGRIADVGVWSTPLTAGEALALAKGARPKDVRRAFLIGYWPLDGLQSPEPDLSGKGNNGTLTGTSAANGPPVTLWTPRRPMFISGTTIIPPSLDQTGSGQNIIRLRDPAWAW